MYDYFVMFVSYKICSSAYFFSHTHVYYQLTGTCTLKSRRVQFKHSFFCFYGKNMQQIGTHLENGVFFVVLYNYFSTLGERNNEGMTLDPNGG